MFSLGVFLESEKKVPRPSAATSKKKWKKWPGGGGVPCETLFSLCGSCLPVLLVHECLVRLKWLCEGGVLLLVVSRQIHSIEGIWNKAPQCSFVLISY